MPKLPRQQFLLIAAIFTVVFGALLIVYFLFFRVPMVPVYQNIRQSDASAIVAQLEKSNIAFQLANEGHDVLVPEDRASEARVAVAGANVALGGTVGFELFDDSDMGLTEFAQKINFQRAMQGELSRTIMTMQGVEFARVHLALPERSIFRAGQGHPTAAVTIQMMQGQPLTRQRIAGIQLLVASSIPGLSQAAVAVLDERGDLVSAVPAAGNGFGAALDERAALARYYEAKASDAIRAVEPGLRFEVTVNARRPLQPTGDEEIGEDRSMPGRAALMLDVSIRTAAGLDEDAEGRIRTAVVDTLSLELQRNDSLDFSVGPVGLANRSADTQRRLPQSPTEAAVTRKGEASSDWSLAGGWRPWAMLAVFLAILMLVLRPRRRLDETQTLSFAEQLKSATPDHGEAHAD